MEGLVEGRIVHYVMPNGEHRPALVVRVWRGAMMDVNGLSNLTVFTDWTNDAHLDPAATSGMMWKTSIVYDGDGAPGTWHWPGIAPVDVKNG